MHLAEIFLYGASAEARTRNGGVGGPCFIQLDYGRITAKNKPRKRACLLLMKLKLFIVDRAHMANEVNNLVAVTHFVVIPRNEFYKCRVKHNACGCVKYARAGFPYKVA